MNEVTSVIGRGIAVRGNDIDTDRIIPARYLRCVTFDGLGEHAFEDDRLQEAEQGKTHPFDDERFAGAKLLVVNSNFGCGSSREHAPQAIMRCGVEAVIGVSFAEIFFGNSVALGMPCVTATGSDVERLQSAIEADPELELALDIEGNQVRFGDASVPVALPDGARRMFLTGQWDATGQLVEGLDQVRAKAGVLPYIGW